MPPAINVNQNSLIGILTSPAAQDVEDSSSQMRNAKMTQLEEMVTGGTLAALERLSIGLSMASVQ